MKVRMVVGISGGRGDGTMWPQPGETLIVSDEEGRDLCAARLAVPVAEEPPVELRTEEDAEQPAGRQRAAGGRARASQG